VWAECTILNVKLVGASSKQLAFKLNPDMRTLESLHTAVVLPAVFYGYETVSNEA
jgi:hypothetical protein